MVVFVNNFVYINYIVSLPSTQGSRKMYFVGGHNLTFLIHDSLTHDQQMIYKNNMHTNRCESKGTS